MTHQIGIGLLSQKSWGTSYQPSHHCCPSKRWGDWVRRLAVLSIQLGRVLSHRSGVSGTDCSTCLAHWEADMFNSGEKQKGWSLGLLSKLYFSTPLHCCCLIIKSSPSLCDPMACSLPGSSVHGISRARILEWVAISSSWGTSQASNRTHVSYVSWIGMKILYYCTTWEAQFMYT